MRACAGVHRREGVAEQAWEVCCNDLINLRKFEIQANVLLESINATREWFWSDAERHKQGRKDMLAARREIAAIAMRKINIFDSALSNELADAYSTTRKELIHLFPSTIPALTKLRDEHIRLCLITNGTGEEQRYKIDRFNLAGFFEDILIEGEIGFGKPDVQIYEIALSQMRLNPSDVWMVGDNLVWDIQAPQSLGIYSIWNDCQNSGLPIDSQIIPNRIINDISELIGFEF
jgi:putative hydrolase of the HAD superfamily